MVRVVQDWFSQTFNDSRRVVQAITVLTAGVAMVPESSAQGPCCWGRVWHDRTPTVSPSSRHWFAMAYEPNIQRAVVFGGHEHGNATLGDTWEWNGGTRTWDDRTFSLTQLPPVCEGPAMAFDPSYTANGSNGAIILFGGYNPNTQTYQPETWAYEPHNNRWLQLPVCTGPVPTLRYLHAMTTVDGGVLMYGGADTSTGCRGANDTWRGSWDSINLCYRWTLVSTPNLPDDGRFTAALASYIIAPSLTLGAVLVGGASSCGTVCQHFCLGTTFGWDPLSTNNWSTLVPSNGYVPQKRAGNAMAGDTLCNEVVLFGGIDKDPPGAVYGDTWVLSYDPGTQTHNWRQVAACGTSPSARHYHGMVHDSVRDEIVMLSGLGGPCGVNCAETWVAARCPADFNQDWCINSSDYFDFLAGFFMVPPDPCCDINQDGFVNARDYFDFLVYFFGGCN